MKRLAACVTICLSFTLGCSDSQKSNDTDQGGNGGDGGTGGDGGKGGQGGKGGEAGKGGQGGGGGGSGGLGGGGAGGAAKPDAAVVDNIGDIAWDFETGTQGWTGVKVDTDVATSTAQKFKGASSLAYNIDVTASELAAAAGADAGADGGTDARMDGGTDAAKAVSPERMLALTAMNTKMLLDVASGTTRPGWSGKMIKLRVYVAGDLKVGYFTLFAIGPPAAWKDSGSTTIVPNTWMELTLAAPVVAMKNPYDFAAFGIFMTGFKAPWKGTIYIDAVEAN